MTLLEARVPSRAPGLELLGQQHGSGYEDTPAAVRRPDGQTIQVTPLLYQLLEAVDGQRDLEQLADELSARTGKSVTPENVRVLLDDKLEPLGLVCDEAGEFRELSSPSPLLALRWKFVITDPKITRRITAPFAALFRPWIVIPVLLAFAATCFWVLFRHGLASATRQAFDSPELLLAVFALTVVSAGWHEFGHAAACRASGARPGAMGAGLYLLWPAFYTDVDDAYRLDRWGRLKVDLGGLYFNTVVAVAIMGAWLATGTDALLLVVATQLLQMLRQLAPVIRADGYHILSDLVGVPDLFHHIKPTLAGLLPQNWGKPQPLRRGPRWAVRAWVLTIVPLLLWMLAGTVLLLPRLAATAWLGLQQQYRVLSAGFVDGEVFTVLAAILKMFSLALPVVAATYLVTRVVRRTARRVWTSTEDHPGRRAAVMLLAGLVVLVLALVWWPSGQYEPVAASERGTLDRAFQLSSYRGSSADEGETTTTRAPAARDAFRPIAGVEPRTGYALVPRDPSQGAVLLVQDDDGELRSIVTDGDATAGQVSGVSFPFELPDAPRPGIDNQALAVNTEDGTVVYDVAVALVWMKDGEVVDNRNEAYALASCTNCTTVAVAFQVVLVVGQSDAVTPVNVAVAANGGCLLCQTTALAVQLVVTLNDVPDADVQRQIEEAFSKLGQDVGSLQDLYDQIETVQQEIVDVLYENGLVDEHNEPTSTADVDSTSESSTTSTTAQDDDDDGASTSPSTTTTTVRTTTTTSSGSTSTSTTTSSTTTTTEPPSTTSTSAP